MRTRPRERQTTTSVSREAYGERPRPAEMAAEGFPVVSRRPARDGQERPLREWWSSSARGNLLESRMHYVLGDHGEPRDDVTAPGVVRFSVENENAHFFSARLHAGGSCAESQSQEAACYYFGGGYNQFSDCVNVLEAFTGLICYTRDVAWAYPCTTLVAPSQSSERAATSSADERTTPEMPVMWYVSAPVVPPKIATLRRRRCHLDRRHHRRHHGFGHRRHRRHRLLGHRRHRRRLPNPRHLRCRLERRRYHPILSENLAFAGR